MDLGLHGKRALVGGGSRGLGAAIGAALAEEGVHVALTARPSADLEAQAARINGIALGLDLSSRPRTWHRSTRLTPACPTMRRSPRLDRNRS